MKKILTFILLVLVSQPAASQSIYDPSSQNYRRGVEDGRLQGESDAESRARARQFWEQKEKKKQQEEQQAIRDQQVYEAGRRAAQREQEEAQANAQQAREEAEAKARREQAKRGKEATRSPTEYMVDSKGKRHKLRVSGRPGARDIVVDE